MSPSKTYTGAVIGAGAAANSCAKGGGHQIGYRHGETLLNHPSVKLTTCADINAENLKAFQTKFSVAGVFLDYKEMLKESRPDIVSICTYVGLHRPMIEACARAGVKGIFCEKPFLPSWTDCQEIQKIAAETGIKIVVAHIRRKFHAFLRARELYNNGTIGKPLICAAGIGGWDMSEWGSHWLDMFCFFHNDQPIKYAMGQARVTTAGGYGHAMEDHALLF